MTLADLRKLTVKRHSRLRFHLQNGMDCIISESGIAQIPELRNIPDFNLEQELEQAQQFVLEPLQGPDPKLLPQTQRLTRQQLSDLIDSSASPGAATHVEHDDD